MPNINLDDAYILDETGAQVDKVTGLFTKDEGTTSGEKAFAQLNIGTAGSNRNLLDNPWFTVNQLGVNGTITNGQYGLDRWMAGGGTVTMATGGITLGADNSYALQRPADPSIFNGKTVTLSVMTSDGVIESGTVVAQTGSAKTVRTANFELCIGYTAYNSFYFYNTSSSEKTIIAAKLELGSVSTLANDAPPEYAEELAKCQYYCRVIETSGYFALGIAAGSAHIQTPLQYAMRARPSVSFTGSIALFGANDLTVSSIIVSAWGPSAVCLDFVTTGATSRTPYIVNMSNAKIILSANL